MTSDSQEERELECVKACTDNGRSVCKTINLAPFVQASEPSKCFLYAEDVYNHESSVIPTLHVPSNGWTTFHLFVRLIFTFTD